MSEQRSAGARFDVELDRHEAKYVIPRALAPAIRRFIQPFCRPDSHGRGDPPEYVVTTLQMDSPGFSLYHAQQLEALNRFKLRVRTYGERGESPVFLEIKRKIGDTVAKSRASVPAEMWGESLIRDIRAGVAFDVPGEEVGFLEFVRLARELGARPAVLIRYTRESYVGRADRYARVTLDRNLLCQPASSWDVWGKSDRWRPMDCPTDQGKQNRFSGLVLELKTLSAAPCWMIDLVMTFDLVRTGYCKYASAIGRESPFLGLPGLPAQDEDWGAE